VTAARVSDDYRETPLWWDGADFPAASDGALPGNVDVAIIGAGYTGLTAALSLSRAGRSVAVLDRADIGGGASGRNAGMVHSGLRRDIEALERRYGERGRALHDASVDAYRHVAALTSEVAPDAGFRECGWVYLAHRKSRLRGLRASERMRRERLGESTRLMTASELAVETRAHGFHGGLLSSDGATVDPGRYLAGLARAVMGAGARIHSRVSVSGVSRRSDGAGLAVNTSGGTVVAGDVLAATNGYTDSALPALRRRVIPIGSYIIATEPLGDVLAAEVSPHRRDMTDTREFLHYWRLTADDRLIFGGRTSFAPVTLQKARDRLYAAMLGFYPQLEGIRITHAWMGNVGFTFDRVPHLGRINGITYAMGYCGSGVAMGSWLGTLAGRWIAAGGDAQRPPFATLTFPTAPGYNGRPWFLPLAGWYYQLKDKIL
jgi:glycine/D-amino acid oxidase-like deaminating enzyme